MRRTRMLIAITTLAFLLSCAGDRVGIETERTSASDAVQTMASGVPVEYAQNYVISAGAVADPRYHYVRQQVIQRWISNYSAGVSWTAERWAEEIMIQSDLYDHAHPGLDTLTQMSPNDARVASFASGILGAGLSFVPGGGGFVASALGAIFDFEISKRVSEADTGAQGAALLSLDHYAQEAMGSSYDASYAAVRIMEMDPEFLSANTAWDRRHGDLGCGYGDPCETQVIQQLRSKAIRDDVAQVVQKGLELQAEVESIIATVQLTREEAAQLRVELEKLGELIVASATSLEVALEALPQRVYSVLEQHSAALASEVVDEMVLTLDARQLREDFHRSVAANRNTIVESVSYAAATVAGWIDRDFGKTFGVALSAIRRVESLNVQFRTSIDLASQMVEAGGISAADAAANVATAALAAGYVGVAVMVVDALLASQAPSPEQVMIDMLGHIANQLHDLRGEMHERFDRVDRRLSSLVQTVATNFELTLSEIRRGNYAVESMRQAIAGAQEDLLRMESTVLFGVGVTLRESFGDAVYKYLVDQSTQSAEYAMSFRDFQEAATEFNQHAVETALNPALNGALQVGDGDFRYARIYDRLQTSPGATENERLGTFLNTNIEFLRQVPAQMLGLPPLHSLPLPNMADWAYASAAYAHLARLWPEHAKVYENANKTSMSSHGAAAGVGSFLATGQRLAEALHQIAASSDGDCALAAASGAETPRPCKVGSPLLGAIIDDYRALFSDVRDAANARRVLFQEGENDRHIRGVDLWGSSADVSPRVLKRSMEVVTQFGQENGRYAGGLQECAPHPKFPWADPVSPRLRGVERLLADFSKCVAEGSATDTQGVLACAQEVSGASSGALSTEGTLVDSVERLWQHYFAQYLQLAQRELLTPTAYSLYTCYTADFEFGEPTFAMDHGYPCPETYTGHMTLTLRVSSNGQDIATVRYRSVEPMHVAFSDCRIGVDATRHPHMRSLATTQLLQQRWQRVGVVLTDPDQVSGIETDIRDKLRDERLMLYAALSRDAADGSGAALERALDSLSGAKALLAAYVSLGMPAGLQGDGLLWSYLFGDGLPDKRSIQQLLRSGTDAHVEATSDRLLLSLLDINAKADAVSKLLEGHMEQRRQFEAATGHGYYDLPSSLVMAQARLMRVKIDTWGCDEGQDDVEMLTQCGARGYGYGTFVCEDGRWVYAGDCREPDRVAALADLYRELLGREPTPGEIVTWVAGTEEAEWRASIVSSAEMQQRLRTLYAEKTGGQEMDAQLLADCTTQLTDGRTMAEILRQMDQRDEVRAWSRFVARVMSAVGTVWH